MMATIRELVIKFGFDVDEAPLKKMETAIEDLKAGFIAVSAAAAAAAASIFGIAKSTANAADAIRDTSIASGISYEELQKLGYAAQLSGSSQEELADSLKFLARASYDAKDANSEAAKTFKTLGVSALDAAGKIKRPDEILYSLADAFKRLPPGVEKSAMALNIFGRSGNKFLQMLDNGSQGLRDLGAEAIDLGIVMNDSAIESGARFNDNLDSLLATIKGVVNVIGSGLIPVVSDILTDMKNWIKSNRELLKTRLQNFIEILTKYLKNLWRVVTAVYYVFRTMIVAIDKVTQSIGGFATVLKALAGLIGLFFLGRMAMAIVDVVKGFYAISKAAIVAWRSVLLGPILIGAAIAAVFLIIEDLIAWTEGRPSFFGFLLKNKDKIFQSILNFFSMIYDKVSQTAKKMLVSFLEFFGVSSNAAIETANIIGNIFNIIKDIILGIVSFITQQIEYAINGIVLLITGIVQTISALLLDPKQAFLDFANMLFDIFKGIGLTILDSIKSISKQLYDVIAGVFSGIISFIGGLVVSAFNSVSNGIINTIMAISDKIKTSIIAPFKNTFGNIAAKLGFDIGNENAIPKTQSMVPMPAISQIQNVASNPFPGVSPANVSNMNTQSSNTEIQSTINVTVPPGSDATAVGEAVRRAASEEFARMLRPAARATKSNVSY